MVAGTARWTLQVNHLSPHSFPTAYHCRQPLSEVAVMDRIRIVSNEKLDGNDPKVFWKKYLQCIPGISAMKADAISSVYPTMTSLIHAYRQCVSEKDRVELLAVGTDF